MAAVPQPESATSQAIYALHAARVAQEDSRGYLGWSEIGTECERALWYGFRSAGRRIIEGRIARLFDSGHREEARVLEELRKIGCEVFDRDETGEQFGVSAHGGHFRGHVDAVVTGLYEAPKTPHLVDVKTAKTKKFDELLKKGMREVYPKYWAQAHGYMGLLELDRAAFIFVCKDDDRMHIERFPFDPSVFEFYMARASRVIRADVPPQRLSDDPASFVCKFCDFHAVCHEGRIPSVSCRTCAHATPVVDASSDARWTCASGRPEITRPREPHDCHRFIPILLAPLGEPADTDGDAVVYRTPAGATFTNGPAPGFTSFEIGAASDALALTMPAVQELKQQFSTARLVA